jgi:hypothetical protein
VYLSVEISFLPIGIVNEYSIVVGLDFGLDVSTMYYYIYYYNIMLLLVVEKMRLLLSFVRSFVGWFIPFPFSF